MSIRGIGMENAPEIEFDTFLSSIKSVKKDVRKDTSKNLIINKKNTKKSLTESDQSNDQNNLAIDATSKNISKESRFQIATFFLNNFKFLCIDYTTLYVFEGPCFRILDKNSGSAFINENLPFEYISKLSLNDYIEILKQIKINPKIQRRNKDVVSNQNAIIFRNGTYYVNEGEFVETFDHRDYSFNYIDHDLDFSQSCRPSPVTRNFLNNILGSDDDLRNLFFESCGYLLSNTNIAKVIFVLWGAPNSGKSTICNIIRDIVGRENCCSIPIQEFSDKHTIAELFGKKICFDSDATGDYLKSKEVSNLKKTTGNDLLYGNKKFGQQFYFENGCKIMIATNNPIRITKSENIESFYSRLIVLPFLNPVPSGEQDPDLREKILDDRNYLLCESLQHLTTLSHRNYRFLKVISTEEYISHAMQADPHVDNFFNSNYRLDSNGRVGSSELLDSYYKYCEENSISNDMLLDSNQLIPELKEKYNLGSYRTNKKRYIQGIQENTAFVE